MENIYSKRGLRRVINAAGRMTKLGVSTISEKVGKTLVEAASNYVLIDSLYQYAGKKLGKMVGSADACVTSSASAGISLSVASLICKNDLMKVKSLSDKLGSISKREVIMLKGHNVDFGAPIAEIVRLGGGKVVEVGYANGSQLIDIESAISADTLAILFVKSHHCVQKDMVDVRDVIALANNRNIPCIVDAAAEEDLQVYASMGADLVCYSGSKAIEGPTSGFVVCKTAELADNMRLQYQGIGRAMKVGKEGIMGLLQAVEEYLEGDYVPAVKKKDMEMFVGKINDIKGCKCNLAQDEAGREIYRAKICFDKNEYGYSARDMIHKLQEGKVAIYTRDYQANVGILAIDPRPLGDIEELNYIYDRIVEISKENKK